MKCACALTDDSIETRQVTINVTPGNPLANTYWSLQTLNVNQIPVGVLQTISFSPASTVTGNGGCNQFNGPYVVSGQSLRIGPLATTSMACEEAVSYPGAGLSPGAAIDHVL